MERENSSSRSPDSPCPYILFTPNNEGLDLLDADFPTTPGLLDSHISSSVEDFPTHIFDTNNSSNGQIQRDLPSGRDYQYNERSSVINFTVERNEYENIWSPVSVPPIPRVGGFQPGLSTASNSSGLSSTTHENSSTSNDNFIRHIFNTAIDTPLSLSYIEPPNLLRFNSSSNRLSTSTAAAAPLSKTEQSHVSSSSISNYSNSSSIPSFNTNLANNTKQQSTISFASQVSSQPTTSSTSHISQTQILMPSCNLNAQLPIGSAKHSHEERGVKRKSSPVMNNSHYLSSASSSSLNFPSREQNLSNNWKKSTMTGSSSHSKVEQVDDDIQIILPETNSLSSAPSGSTSNNEQPVTVDSSQLNPTTTSQQATTEGDRIQDSPPTIPEASEADDLIRLLDDIYNVRENNGDPFVANVETIQVSEGEDSSSSSIVSIHEVEEGNSAKQALPIPKKVPNTIPSVITIEDSPKNEELLEIKIKQEAENVKEDFKKLLEDELICNICTELLIKPITLGCSHTFCKFCISEWKEKKNQCPMCRAAVVTETPCLFLDNFISKAVEQLDPESVEKRLEIIKTREELLKNKVHKPRFRLSQALIIPPNPRPRPLYMNMPFSAHSSLQPSTNVHHSSNLISQRLISQDLNLFSQNIPARPRRSPTNFLQDIYLERHRPSSLYNQIITSVFEPLSSVVPQSSSSNQQPSRYQQPQQSANVPQLSSNLLQQSSNVPQLPSNLLQQSSNPHVPMNTYYF